MFAKFRLKEIIFFTPLMMIPKGVAMHHKTRLCITYQQEQDNSFIV
jgi:hypothetical protein